MPASSLARVMIEGPAGPIETDVNDPGGARRGIALIAHPNPVQGGTKDNKVVTTLAKAFFALGYVAVRPELPRRRRLRGQLTTKAAAKPRICSRSRLT